MRKRNLKFCPVCGSLNVEWELPHTWSTWRCRDCGYIGGFIIEDGEMAQKIRVEYKRSKEKEDDSESS